MSITLLPTFPLLKSEQPILLPVSVFVDIAQKISFLNLEAEQLYSLHSEEAQATFEQYAPSGQVEQVPMLLQIYVIYVSIMWGTGAL